MMTKPDTTTPAPSGAAPAESPSKLPLHELLAQASRLMRFSAERAAFAGQMPRTAKEEHDFADALGDAADAIRDQVAALASREASSAPLTDDQIDYESARINRTDDSWQSLPHRRLARWAFEKGSAAALASPQVASTPKPLDDPKLQQWFGDAIEGAMAFGFMGNNPPPEGHWLTRFWNIGRAEAMKAAAPVQVAPAGWKLVPVEPTAKMISAMSTSKGRDDEGEFPALMDLIDYSGENKTHAVLKAAYREVLAAAPMPTPAAADDARDAAKVKSARDEGFTAGTIAAMAVVFAFDQETTWAEVLNAAGREKVLQHAAHIEPDAWKWAGFSQYLGKKPRRTPAAKPADPAEEQGS